MLARTAVASVRRLEWTVAMELVRHRPLPSEASMHRLEAIDRRYGKGGLFIALALQVFEGERLS